MVGHPHAEELVRTQAECVQDRWVEAGQWAVGDGGDHRVVPSAQAQGAVGELGGESSVPAGDLPFAQQRWEHEVGVGVTVGDGAERVPRGTARWVGAASPLPGRLTTTGGVRALATSTGLPVAMGTAAAGAPATGTRVATGASATARPAARWTAARGVHRAARATPSNVEPCSRRAPRAQSAAAIHPFPGGET